MTNVTLSVSFPEFGRNYFAQNVVMRSHAPLIEDDRFDVFLIPAAERHFSNGVVGFHDQFRFLSDVLDAHMTQTETADSARQAQRPTQSQRL
ncbi:hypothetical protein [Pseudomonas baltica]|uniref:hypothetical protein n=1 Tax=Pseudomonas baltica TaxID=2762576 RepID=UPI003908AE0D